MEEIWKDINGYEELYKVSNLGRVKSLGNGNSNTSKMKILKPIINKTGYLSVSLCKNSNVKIKLIHILVAEHFIENSKNKTIVHHIDHNKKNNNVSNLMWVTNKEHFDLHPEFINSAINITSKKINQYTKEGVFVKTFISSMEAERETGIGHSDIIRCCRGGYFKKGKWENKKTAGNYIWKYAEDL